MWATFWATVVGFGYLIVDRTLSVDDDLKSAVNQATRARFGELNYVLYPLVALGQRSGHPSDYVRTVAQVLQIGIAVASASSPLRNLARYRSLVLLIRVLLGIALIDLGVWLFLVLGRDYSGLLAPAILFTLPMGLALIAAIGGLVLRLTRLGP